jgi:mono/diheme cytochrome c family protein
MRMNTTTIASVTGRILLFGSVVVTLSGIAGSALAQRGFGGGGYPQQTGEAIYKGVCQGCHMPDAKGAAGAGIYPALAGDKKLGAKFYPALVVVRGQKAMPEFGSSFSDLQIANVVNYIRSNFGNAYTDVLTPEDVKKMRPVAK